MVWGAHLGSIGTNALYSYIAGKGARKQAQAQAELQMADRFRQGAREYAQLTEAVKAQGRHNEAVARTNMYNLANIMSNEGAAKLHDSNLRSIAAQNKLRLGTDGKGAKATTAANAAAVGAVGSSVRAMQQNIQKNLDEALTNLERTRQNQVYDANRRTEVNYTQYYQNMQELDESEINKAFLPEYPTMVGSSSGYSGGFLPHLIGAGLSHSLNHKMQEWSLQLGDRQQETDAQFGGGGGYAQAYPYR